MYCYCVLSNQTYKLKSCGYLGFTHIYNTASCLPYVPEKGSVGASGDLAPLSHLAVGLMGEGQMWSPESGWAKAEYVCYTIINGDMQNEIRKM